MDEFSRLESRITAMVNELKRLRRENRELTDSLSKIQEEKDLDRKERDVIRSKVKTLLQMVDALEKNGQDD